MSSQKLKEVQRHDQNVRRNQIEITQNEYIYILKYIRINKTESNR